MVFSILFRYASVVAMSARKWFFAGMSSHMVHPACFVIKSLAAALDGAGMGDLFSFLSNFLDALFMLLNIILWCNFILIRKCSFKFIDVVLFRVIWFDFGFGV